MYNVKLTKTVPGLPYKVGDTVTVSRGVRGMVWHVWKTLICLPEDSYTKPEYTDKWVIGRKKKVTHV